MFKNCFVCIIFKTTKCCVNSCRCGLTFEQKLYLVSIFDVDRFLRQCNSAGNSFPELDFDLCGLCVQRFLDE